MAITKGGLLIDPDSLSYTLKFNSSSITWVANIATVTSVLPHGYVAGDLIHVGGVDVEGFDGNFTVLASGLTTNVFKYDLTTNPGAIATVPGYSYKATKELLVDQVRKTIKLIRVGNLTADGVSLKCLYSKLKELWKSDTTLIKYPFPMIPITDEQFEFVNGWNIENKFSSITEITVVASGLLSSNATDAVTGATTSVITTAGNFITSGVEVGMYIGYNIPGLPYNNGGTSGQEGAKVVSVTTTTCTLDKLLLGDFTAKNVKFWSKNDHSYNLIRSGGWAWKSEDGAYTREEWMNASTLGSLGLQGATVTLTGVTATAASVTVTWTGSNGNPIVGSYVTAPGLMEGSKIATVDLVGKSLTLIAERPAKANLTAGVATVRPKDQVYYQLGTATTTGKVFALTGAVNQALRYKQLNVTGLTASAVITTTSITSIVWASQTCTVTSTSHGLTTGEYAEIKNSGSSLYDGVVKVTVTGPNTFTFVEPYDGGSIGAVGTVGRGCTLTSVSSTAGLYVGLGISGTGIPSGASILEILSSTSIALTNSATVASLTGLSTGSDVGKSTSVQKFYVREQGYTYAVATKEQIGVSVPTYKLYSYPLQNTLDLNVTHSDVVVAGTSATGSWTGNVATLSTGTTAHGFTVSDVGASITVSGMTPTTYNGVYVIASVPTTTSLTYALVGTGIAAGTGGWVNKSVYANVNVQYLRDPLNSNAQYTIKGDYANGTAYVLSDVAKDTGNSRWYKCILAYTGTATLPSADATHWTAYEGERQVGGVYAAYNVIIDGDVKVANFTAAIGELTSVGTTATLTHSAHGVTNGDKITIEGALPAGYNGFYTATVIDANTLTYTTTASGLAVSTQAAQVRNVTKYLQYGNATRFEVYEKHQYLLRQNSDIDVSTNGSQNGQIAAQMLVFVGPTLVTSNGVYIDNFAANDTNDIQFYDGTGALREYLYVSTLTLSFGDNLRADPDAKYWVFFTSVPQGAFGTSDAFMVQTNELADMTGTVGGASSAVLTFNYDGNIQGGRSLKTDAPVTVVAVGLNTGQYVKSTGTIAKSKSNSVSLVASLERNYANVA